MEMLVYLILAAVVYGIVADDTDRGIERETRKRLADNPSTTGARTFSVSAVAHGGGSPPARRRAVGVIPSASEDSSPSR